MITIIEALFAAFLALVSTINTALNQEYWRGLVVAPEERCAPLDGEDYSYSSSWERVLVDAYGGVYGPYTGTWFEDPGETDIEHIVAVAEAHDSGLCAADLGTKTAFANDPLNLTLASPAVNRWQKSANDVAEWLPEFNRCWYVNRTVAVRQKYGLTIDEAEAVAIDAVLVGCTSGEMQFGGGTKQ